MKKNENKPAAVVALSTAVLVGFVVTLFCMAISAIAVLSGGLSADSIPLWADVCLGLGSFCAAIVAARRTASWRLLWGLGAGMLLFVCLIVLSLAWFGQGVYFPRLLVNTVLSAVCAAAGGALGAKRRKRKKYRK